MYLGIDIGGTFTDLVLMDDGGNISTAKAPTTPGELEKGVFDAIAIVAATQGLAAEELLGRVVAFGHGTTQATNALIERTGAATGLVATRGFGDTLALQRLMGFTAGIPVENLGRYSRRRYPVPIVPRRLVREVRERVDQAGRVLVPLDEESVRGAVHELIEAGAQTFAVALLWSFRNPAHEKRVGEIIREMQPGAYVSLSCEVSPIIGEYERTATTALNSYLAPKVARYLDRIESLLRDRGFRGKFNVLNSAGGVVPAHEAARKPVLLVASGPAGGVMGSLQLAQEIGHDNVITTDMGGTSFDVALVVDGKALVSGTHEAGGFHLNTPVIDIRGHRRGRRLDRPRRGRPVAGRAGQRRRRSRPGLLRPRRQARHCHRRRSGARHSFTRQFSRRPDEARRRRGDRGDPRADRNAARHECRSGGGRHPPGGRWPHGRHPARGHDRAGPRSAGFRVARLWRRRTFALRGLRRRAWRAAHPHSVNQHGAFGLRRARLRRPTIRRAVAGHARRRRRPRSLGRARL